MNFESGYSVSIEKNVIVECDMESMEEINNDYVEPINDSSDSISLTTTISNISVPQTRRTKLTNVVGSPSSKVKSGGDIISDPVESYNGSVSRPITKGNQATRRKISSNKGSTYCIALVQAFCMTHL